MNRIAKFTRLDPHKRYQYIQALAHKIVKEAKNQWGIEIEDSAPTVTAHILKPPRIRIGSKQEVEITKGNFQIRDPIYDKDVTIRDWAIIYSTFGRGNRDDQLADDLAYNLRQCGKQLGIKVKKPEYISFNPKNRKVKVSRLISNYMRNQRSRGKALPQCVVVLLGDRE